MQGDSDTIAGDWFAGAVREPGRMAGRRRLVRWPAAAIDAYWRSHVAVFASVALSLVLVLAVGRAYGINLDFSIYGTLPMFGAELAFVILIVAIVAQLAINRPASPISFLWQKFAHEWKLHKRVVYAAPTILALTVFMSAFSSFKSGINVIQPYYFDPAIAHFDRILFFGHDAWQVLQPLIGYPPITFALNIAYNIWLVMLCGTVLVAAMMTGNDRLRAQYLIAFVLCWVLIGSLLATMFSSVGPCFYQAFYGTDRFAGLMTYLHGVNVSLPLWALSTQDMLLATYRASETGLGSGISAMPSMHLAMTTLTVLLCFRLNRKAGFAAVGFLILIFLGSIHLGWHYASDGLLSMALVPGIWWVAGRIADLPFRRQTGTSAAGAAA